MVNLLVDLSGDRFKPAAAGKHEIAVRSAGYTSTTLDRPDDDLLAWIDEVFGGAWSSEAFAGKNIVIRRDNGLAGFASYDVRGMRYRWLRAWRDRGDVGIFGPIGIHETCRGSGLGAHVLMLALCGLRAAGYNFALVPAVGPPGLIQYYMRETGASVVEEFASAHPFARVRTTVLASGNGTNFQAVIDATTHAGLWLDIGALVSNRASARALARAKEASIPTRVTLEWDRKVESRATYDARLLHAVSQTEPQLILLLGWMHLLSAPFVSAFGETINIHPAFLPHDQSRDTVGMPDGTEIPAFRGAHAIADALAFGSRWSGASAHRVTVGTDRGPVLVRKPIAIQPGWTQSRVVERLRPVEHAVLLGGIRRWLLEREG